MKVLLATPWMAPLGGGLERYAADLGRTMAREGHDVTLLAHAPAPVAPEEDGVRRVCVAPEFQLSNTPLSLGIHRAATALLAQERFDVVNVHTPVPGTAELVAHAARLRGIPYAVTYHAGLLGAPRGPLSLAAWLHARTFERRMLSRASARVAVSPFVGRHVFRDLSHIVVSPGVDAGLFRPRGSPVPGRILFVGPVSRAYAWKGFAVLADAFRLVAGDILGAHLCVVGNGDLVEHHRAALAGYDARFLGRLSDDALAEAYSQASVVVLPSLTDAESFGMVLAEANACARPVVASRVGGIPSFVIDGDNGLLVPPGDSRALADAIGRLLLDPALARRMGQRGRRRVVREHAWEDISRRTLRALEAH